ncbi:MAG: bifunctional UDP-sugar hydrolase/5'-nucleotidase [Armatimonadetes bacterium]|nr:bifunctional UDP-sugar hydrolase/5'-nucleotidase [Armatimonadota bacterium]
MNQGARFIRRFFAVLTVLLILSSMACADSRYVRLTILHTNDTHSHLLPFSYPSTVMVEGQQMNLPAYKDIGGIARRATLIKRIRAEQNPALVLDAGDIIDGSPFSVEFAGEADFAAVNAAGYDAAVTGNHEYSNTYENFNKRLFEAEFPVIGANVYRISTDSPILTPYIMRNEDGLRVAILGLVTPNNYTAVKEGNLEIKDPITVAKEWVPKLRECADAVILLTHIGFDEDRKLAEQVPGIDAIIGGHSHTRLEHPVLVKHAPDSDPFSIDGTVIAQDFQWGGDLGEVDLVFRKGDSGWTLMSYGGKLIPVTNDIPEDAKVREVVEKYNRQIASKYDVVLGEATADFIAEAPINMVSDALREAYNADFAMQNYGGVRTDLVQGPITMGDIATLFPFGNWVQTFQATGAQIKGILLKSKPAVSGIKYKIEGGKLVSAEIGGKPIEDAKVYNGVTHVFFAQYEIPKEINMGDGKAWVRDLIIKYIQGKKTILPDGTKRAEID